MEEVRKLILTVHLEVPVEVTDTELAHMLSTNTLARIIEEANPPRRENLTHWSVREHSSDTVIGGGGTEPPHWIATIR